MAIDWWNNYYRYRREIVFDKQLEPGKYSRFYLPLTLVEQNKIREDLLDIRIVLNGSYVLDENYFLIEESEEYIIGYLVFDEADKFDISFTGENGIPQCHVYYGDPDLSSPEAYEIPATPPTPPTTGGLSVPDNPQARDYEYRLTDVQYSNPGEDWNEIIVLDETDSNIINKYIVSPASAATASLSLNFYGSKAAVYAKVGPAYGIIGLDLDDNYVEIDLYEDEEEDGVLIFIARNLHKEQHRISITNTGQRNPAAIRVGDYYPADTTLENEYRFLSKEMEEPIIVCDVVYDNYSVGIMGLEEVSSTVSWNSKIGGPISV